MTDINTSNAIAQERARIREEVLDLSIFGFGFSNEVDYVKLTDVLEIIRNDMNHEGTT